MGHELAAFLGISALVIMTPGQDTALTIRNTMLGGRRAGLFTALGAVCGQAVWAVAASTGLAAVLAASEVAFTAIRMAGAAYLVVLGAQALLHAARRTGARAPTPERSGLAARPLAAYRQGVISDLGNPKVAVFFTGLLPQFGHGSFGAMLAFGLVFSLLTLSWLTVYAVAIARARRALERPAIRRALDAVMGSALVAFGVRLAAEQR